jgi:hypothetical protein
MGVVRMTGERYLNSQGPWGRDDGDVRSTRFAASSESRAANAIMGIAMVGLLGGGPRLAMRAARVVLADGYVTRSRAREDRRPRDGRLRGRVRHRGD